MTPPRFSLPTNIADRTEQLSPTANDATRIIRSVFDVDVKSVKRFPTGLCHFIYDVVTAHELALVVRIGHPDNRKGIEGSVYWSNKIPQDVPLPKLLYTGLDGKVCPFPFTILERLPGVDLQDVYAELSSKEKHTLAGSVAHIQASVATIPPGRGFGHTFSYECEPAHHSWQSFIAAHLGRSKERMEKSGIGSRECLHLAERRIRDLSSYLDSVEPLPFLDDATTKNVLVQNGALSGIVDVDSVCFGDSLLTVALTQTALLDQGFDLEYIKAWVSRLNPTPLQRDALKFYSMLFCLDFVGEMGQKFNRPKAPGLNEARLLRLERILRSDGLFDG